MGHREDLLEGAKRCLLEKGYARTTARDIVRESGTNLASIGYHYGSKEALLREALFTAMGEWADDVQEAVEADLPPSATLRERFEAGWSRATELATKHQKLWTANIEAVLRAEDDEALQTAFAQAQPEARKGLVTLFNGVPESEVSEQQAQVFGSLYQALVSGLVVQKTLDPEYTLPAHDLVEAMRRIVMGTAAAPSPSGTDTGGTGRDCERDGDGGDGSDEAGRGGGAG